MSQLHGNIIDVWCNIFTTEGTELYYNSQAQEVAAQVFGMHDMYDPSNGMSADDFVQKMDRNGTPGGRGRKSSKRWPGSIRTSTWVQPPTLQNTGKRT